MDLDALVASVSWREIGGWIFIVAVASWLFGGFALELLGRRKIQDLRTGKVSKAWWFGRRSRKKPPGPFLKS